MRAPGVCGLEARIDQQGSKVRGSLKQLCSCFFLALQVASAPTCLVPNVLVTHTYAHLSPAAEERLHIVSSKHQSISQHLGSLQQSRNEEVSPTGNSRTTAGHRLCMQSEKAELSSAVSCRFIQQRRALLGTAGSFGWGKEASICGGGRAGKHSNKDMVTSFSEEKKEACLLS